MEYLGMKTLQVFNIYQQYGGEENVVRSLSRVMADREWRDVFFESREWANESVFGKLTQPLRTFWNGAALRTLEKAHLEHQADVWLLHNVLPVGSLGVFHLAARLGVPIIQYMHSYRPFSPGGTAWGGGRLLPDGLQRNFWPEIALGTYRGSRLQTLFFSLVLQVYFRRGAFKAVTTWLSQTHFQKGKFVEAGIAEQQIEVLRPPRPLSAAPEHWTDEGYLMFLGRLVPEKGIGFLLEQWERDAVDGDGPKLPPLVIAGGGPMESEVVRRVESLNRVRFVGQVDALERQRLLSSCSALVVPSEWWEVFGIVVLEAFEMEKPVLVSRTGGLGEIVADEVTGFHFEPSDAVSFRNAITRMMGLTLEQRRQMGQNGRQWVMEAMHPERWVTQYQALAQRTVERKRKPIGLA